jgi:hypothetical protein
MSYQRKTLPNTNIGNPGPLPSDIAGLEDASLANLSAALGPAADELGYAGQGFFFVADPPPAPVIPQVVSRMQAKMALQNAGLLASVESTVAAGTAATQIYWADAPDFHRDHPVLLSLATALNLSSAQVDALFTAAAIIT